MNQMSQEDYQLFRAAEAHAHAGRTLVAYRMFCLIESHGNTDLEVRFWILQTTPNYHEARSLLAWLEREAPNHRALPQARTYVATHWQSVYVAPVPAALGPMIRCPHCGHVGATVIDKQIAQAGWIVCVVLLVLGILSVLLVPCLGVLLIVLCWLGLLIQERRCTCARCSAKLATL